MYIIVAHIVNQSIHFDNLSWYQTFCGCQLHFYISALSGLERQTERAHHLGATQASNWIQDTRGVNVRGAL